MDFLTGDLKSAFCNGTDVKTVASTSEPNNREIAVGEDFVFYTSLTHIFKVHKSSGHMPAIVHTGKSTMYGLLLYKQDGKNILTYVNDYTNICVNSSSRYIDIIIDRVIIYK